MISFTKSDIKMIRNVLKEKRCFPDERTLRKYCSIQNKLDALIGNDAELAEIEKIHRLVSVADVIRAVDRHTNDDGTLDDDITCILEEVPTKVIVRGNNTSW